MINAIEVALARTRNAAYCSALVLFFGLGLVSQARADCPHCYDIVKVRAEFRDGSVRDGFYEHHSSVVPIVTDADGTKRIAFDQSSPNFPPVEQIRLIDTVYQFPRITNCTTPAAIDTVPVASIKRLVYLGKVAYGGAGQINVFDTSVVRLLGETPFQRFDTTYSLSEVVYLSYVEHVTEEDLRHLGEFLGRPGGLDNRFRLLVRRVNDALSGSSSPPTVIRHFLTTEIAAIPQDEQFADRFSTATPVGSYFKAIADNLRYRREALFAIQLYLQTPDRSRLVHDLSQIADSAGCTVPDNALTKDSSDPLALVPQAMQIVQTCLSLSRTLGDNYQLPLMKSGIVYVENPFD